VATVEAASTIPRFFLGFALGGFLIGVTALVLAKLRRRSGQ
jgi:hypothetical protein